MFFLFYVSGEINPTPGFEWNIR